MLKRIFKPKSIDLYPFKIKVCFTCQKQSKKNFYP